jgi:hypothetical protein
MKFAASVLAKVALGNGIEVLVVSEYLVAMSSAAVNRPCARTRMGLNRKTYNEDTSTGLRTIMGVKKVKQ